MQQQHLMQMQPMMAAYYPNNVTTDHIQQVSFLPLALHTSLPTCFSCCFLLLLIHLILSSLFIFTTHSTLFIFSSSSSSSSHLSLFLFTVVSIDVKGLTCNTLIFLATHICLCLGCLFVIIKHFLHTH